MMNTSEERIATMRNEAINLDTALRRIVAALNEPGIMDVDLWKAECREATLQANYILRRIDGVDQ